MKNKENLINECYCQEQFTVKYIYTDAEITELKNILFDIAKKIALRVNINLTFKQIINDSMLLPVLKSKILELELDELGDIGLKDLKKIFDEHLTLISDGYTMRSEIFYGFDDQEKNIMQFFDINGEYSHERELNQSEKQLNLNSEAAKQKKTNEN